MAKKRRSIMGANKDGWKVDENSTGSTTSSLPLSAKDIAEMKNANTKPGFLSSGYSVFSNTLFGTGYVKETGVLSGHGVAGKKRT